MAVIYRHDRTVRRHPLVNKLPAAMVKSFELQLVRVGSTSPLLAVVNVLRPPSTDVGIFVDELANALAAVVSGRIAIICCCPETSTARRRLARVLMNDCQRRSWSSD